ncbi:plantaricin C family lantibiotic [Baia soyae]|uniref:Two-component lantibiotic alpha peptide n=1 Tax=Baia soyae TaxID=1544746 RepID=A0A4V2SYF8_9BACL|nr:plantaricin C family lantibiotic [Baia soyae]TCP70223.1 two-component lantibiotic alpha peptide [Baia soyae]
MGKDVFMKNPVLRKKVSPQFSNPSGEVLEEVKDHSIVGAGCTKWDFLVTSLVCCGASYVLGNKGHLCTGTVECQNNCRD